MGRPSQPGRGRMRNQLKARVGRERLEPAAFVADLCDVSDRLNDERLAAGHVATVAAAPEGSRARRRADRPSHPGLIE